MRIALVMEWGTLREKVGQCGNREPYQEAIADNGDLTEMSAAEVNNGEQAGNMFLKNRVV